MNRLRRIGSAQVVLPCDELDDTLAFFSERLGFRVDAVFPADAPRVAVLSGHGVCVRLDRGASGDPGTLRLECEGEFDSSVAEEELLAPNGTRIELVAIDPPLVMPPPAPSLVITRLSDGSGWQPGRAGMRYRDLIPDRQGGRFIASHIQIPDEGPVPDYVHFHKVHFQLIYCYRGWVKVVYEEQGPPFVLNAGDCVVQPPQIRHRVLECSAGLEVIEIGCPAEHQTLADHQLSLPTDKVQPERRWAGQRFTRHEVSKAEWLGSPEPGFEVRDLGIGRATDGIAGARVLRSQGGGAGEPAKHDAELRFRFVLEGGLELDVDARSHPLVAGDAFVVPAGVAHTLGEPTPDLEILEISLPAEYERS